MEDAGVQVPSVLDAALDPAILVNQFGRLIHMNPAAESFFEFVLKNPGEPLDVLTILRFKSPGVSEWRHITKLITSSRPKQLNGLAYPKSGREVNVKIQLSMVNMRFPYDGDNDDCATAYAIYLRANSWESEVSGTSAERFDYMSRYMSTVLQMLSSIIETCLDPIFQINQHGLIQMVNPAATKLFGYTKEEFMGKNITIIMGGVHAERHDEYMRRYLKTRQKRVMGKKRILSARHKDGTEFPIELGLVEVTTEEEETMFVGFVRDLTDIQTTENLAMGIVEASLDPVFGIDETGRIQFANEAAVRLFGFSREEFMGCNIDVVVGTSQEDEHNEYLKNYLRKDKAKLMYAKHVIPARCKDGTPVQIEIAFSEMKSCDVKENKLFVGFVRHQTETHK